MNLVGLTLTDFDATVYREIPADLLERLMETDDTVKLAEIAREIREHVKAADDAVAESYGGMQSFSDAAPD